VVTVSGTELKSKINSSIKRLENSQRPKPPPGARNAACPQRVTWRRRSRDQSIRHISYWNRL